MRWQSCCAQQASPAGDGRFKSFLAGTKVTRLMHFGRIGAGESEPPHVALRVRPDFTFPILKVAVFVDGCFWHGCPKHSNLPANNRAFWLKKLTANKERDRLVTRTLRQRGWRLLRIWEHELARKNEARLMRRLESALGFA